MKRLYDRLEEYARQDYYGFHMPGHKRNEAFMGISLPYRIDITEIEGFDDLHHADGILKEAQERAACVFGAKETYFLINGSTAGILSAILGCTEKGDKILIARHCHKSVYHAMYLNELVPRYLYPQFDTNFHINGEILQKDVEWALQKEPDIRAVVIVSPSYDGVISDVKGIAEAVHRYGIPLIVDEAHGAHLGFHEYFPERANRLGADVVINSLHKTLPSLTQTALLHWNGGFADGERIRKYLDMFQSSSPSYLFMASLDACADLLEKRKEEVFSPYAARLQKLREMLGNLRRLRLVQTERYDLSKLVISTAKTDLTSKELYETLLQDYRLQMEMAAGTYVLAMTSIADTEEGFRRLASALAEIDDRIGDKEKGIYEMMPGGELPRQEQIFTPYEADSRSKKDMEEVSWRESEGRISLEYAYLYPPGSPVIVPGERISREAISLLAFYEEQGFRIEGIHRERFIRALKS